MTYDNRSRNTGRKRSFSVGCFQSIDNLGWRPEAEMKICGSDFVKFGAFRQAITYHTYRKHYGKFRRRYT